MLLIEWNSFIPIYTYDWRFAFQDTFNIHDTYEVNISLILMSTVLSHELCPPGVFSLFQTMRENVINESWRIQWNAWYGII